MNLYVNQIEQIFRKDDHKIYLLMILNGALNKFKLHDQDDKGEFTPDYIEMQNIYNKAGITKMALSKIK